MSRWVLGAVLILAAAGVIVVARVHRYQYLLIVGPSWHGTGTETDTVRIDRWTGKPQVWVCHDVDTSRMANVPPPPTEPATLSTSDTTVDAAARRSAYRIALKQWRADHPNVNPDTLRVTRARCGWQPAR